MTLKEIKSGTVSGTAVIRVEKLNDGKGLLKSQRNPKKALILLIE